MKRRRFPHDDEERRKRQDPESILRDIGLGPGFVFVDVGCGEGFFAIPAAGIVGKSGMVYGLDVNGETVDKLGEIVKAKGLKNLSLRVGKAEELVMCDSCADIVFFGLDFHEFEDRAKVLVNAKRMLKPGGALAVLDWKKEPMDFGPPFEERISEDEAARLVEAAGFEVEFVKDAGAHHYLLKTRP
ncbi:MAG: methyltransferase domain-containing protein [Methanobacteriota archaeon]